MRRMAILAAASIGAALPAALAACGSGDGGIPGDAGAAGDGDATLPDTSADVGARADGRDGPVDSSADRATDSAVDAVFDGGGPDVHVPASVLTQHNDTARTGAYLDESVLTPANVRAGTFGKLFTRVVDDEVYAQPLVVSNVTIPGKGVHDVLIVATMNDSVYAFDADDAASSAPLWTRSFLDMARGIVAVSHADVGQACGTYTDLDGNIGVESTPVIDPLTHTLYAVAKTKDQTGAQTYELYALDASTGQDRIAPAVLQASVGGTGAGTDGMNVAFDATLHNQRPSLLLANGNVYIAFASYCDSGNYHGWVLAYDAATLTRTAAWNDTPNGAGGGIWMSGQGPAADGNGNIYVTVGNGDMDVNMGGQELGEALVKLSPSLALVDWFVPFDYVSLNSGDLDFGSAGIVLLPGGGLTLTGAKSSTLYLNAVTNLGHLNAADNSQIAQSIVLGAGEVHGTPVSWADKVYVWAAGDVLRSYQLTGGQLVPSQMGPMALGSGQPGGFLSLSALGTTAGTGVLWVTQPASGDANPMTVPGILQAFDASNITSELWDSLQTPGDDCGNFAKFDSATVFNGKVYLPTFSNQLCVYGRK